MDQENQVPEMECRFLFQRLYWSASKKQRYGYNFIAFRLGKFGDGKTGGSYCVKCEYPFTGITVRLQVTFDPHQFSPLIIFAISPIVQP